MRSMLPSRNYRSSRGGFLINDMELVNPEHIAAALAPLLDTLDTRINDALQKAIDRLNGMKISITLELPPQ